MLLILVKEEGQSKWLKLQWKFMLLKTETQPFTRVLPINPPPPLRNKFPWQPQLSGFPKKKNNFCLHHFTSSSVKIFLRKGWRQFPFRSQRITWVELYMFVLLRRLSLTNAKKTWLEFWKRKKNEKGDQIKKKNGENLTFSFIRMRRIC